MNLPFKYQKTKLTIFSVFQSGEVDRDDIIFIERKLQFAEDVKAFSVTVSCSAVLVGIVTGCTSYF